MPAIASRSLSPQARGAIAAWLYALLAHGLLSYVSGGQPGTLLDLLKPLWGILPPSLRQLGSDHLRLLLRCTWAAVHVAVYVPLPWLLARLVGLRSSDLGLQPADWTRVRLLFGIAAAVLLLIVLLFSTTRLFAGAYPMFRPSQAVSEAPAPWLVAMLAMAAHLLSVEFFFRGFLPALSVPVLGRWGALATLLPYVASHAFWPEAIGALPFGLFLLVLRERCGSLWPGYALHLALALILEGIALRHQGLL